MIHLLHSENLKRFPLLSNPQTTMSTPCCRKDKVCSTHLSVFDLFSKLLFSSDLLCRLQTVTALFFFYLHFCLALYVAFSEFHSLSVYPPTRHSPTPLPFCYFCQKNVTNILWDMNGKRNTDKDISQAKASIPILEFFHI